MTYTVTASSRNSGDHASKRLARRIGVTNGHVVTAGCCVILLPNVLFATHLAPVEMAIMLAGCLGLLALLATRPALGPDAILSQPLAVKRLGASLAIALLLLLLGGEGHLFFSNWDWLWRDAVLADLAHSPFPPGYEVGDQAFFLRAPLGMYMLPALVAHATSLGIGHAVLLAQNALLFGVVLYMLATLSGRRAVLVLAVFLAFSGLDIVGTLIMALKRGEGFANFVLPSHIESWIGLQYSSVVTQLFWVPNHALPSYWLALLAVLCAKREGTPAELGLALAASLFWSPFAFIGVLPLAAYLLIRDIRVTVAAPRFWLAVAAGLCFLPVALYLRIDAEQVPREFILLKPTMASSIALFLLIEIPHLAIIRHVWAKLDPALKGLLTVSIVVLFVLPAIRFGASNDLVMRASIPALMVLAMTFAEALAIAWHERKSLLAAGVTLALLGAVSPMQEIVRSLTFHSFAISDCNVATVWKKLMPQVPTMENYFAGVAGLPGWLSREGMDAPLLDQRNKVCWPDIPYDPRSPFTEMSNDMLRHAEEPEGSKL